ncbi:MAG: YabP/YqfC family sporulation protein [Lachnospiraceae bacterium]|nr:YabP/YqfC family sporulation protein [Lachnospiraceae bacterium]
MRKKWRPKDFSLERNRRLEEMSSYMQLTPDVLADSALIHVYGMQYVRIENYKGIIGYQDTFVKLMTKDGLLQIMGKNLELAYCSDIEVCVSGRIQQVIYGTSLDM